MKKRVIFLIIFIAFLPPLIISYKAFCCKKNMQIVHLCNLSVSKLTEPNKEFKFYQKELLNQSLPYLLIKYCENQKTIGSNFLLLYDLEKLIVEHKSQMFLVPLKKYLNHLSKVEDIPSQLFIFGKLIQLISDKPFFETSLIRELALSSLKIARSVSYFERENPWIHEWVEAMNRITSVISISPLLIDFFETHPEFLNHQNLFVRFNTINLMCTYYWTFNKISICKNFIQNFKSQLSSIESKQFFNKIQTLLLVANYMDGRLSNVLELANQLENSLFLESGTKPVWLQIIKASANTFLGNYRRAEAILRNLKGTKKISEQQLIDVHLAELSHLLYVERFKEATASAQVLNELLLRNYEPLVYPHIVLTLYRLVISIREAHSWEVILKLYEQIKFQTQTLPADECYVDMARIYLAKAQNQPTNILFSELEQRMGPRVPASFRVRKALSDNWKIDY